MERAAKPKHQLLQEFSATLLRLNPMQLKDEDPLEYESEALSVLSRFSESALHLADDEALVAEVATNIVKQTFEYWFDTTSADINYEQVARELVAVYRTAHEPETPGVETVTIGT